MKKYIIILLLITLLFIDSCDPNRVDTPFMGQTEATFFTDVIYFRQNVIAVYARLSDYYFYNVGWSGDWVAGTWLLPGDDLTETTGTRTDAELFDGTLNPTNSRLEYIFQVSYKLIARANVTIDKVNTVDFSKFDGAAEIAQIKGEALFLRGYAYFKLFNIFGNVPIVTERIITQSATNTPKSDKLEVLNQAIADASAAIDILPESWPAEYAGRATKNSARGLLAKALVFRADYTGATADFSQALTVFSTITATLTADYTDNFNAVKENNQESLFEVQASEPNSGFDNVFLYNDGPWRGVEDMSIFRGYMTKDGDGATSWAGTKFIITKKLLNNFGTDPRISFFLEAGDGYGGLLFQKYSKTGLDLLLVNSFSTSANNERELRYADLKLLAAEAALKTGTITDAIKHINDIRSRARAWALVSGAGDGSIPADRSISETNTSTIMQWIMDERFVELAGEGQRWWDMKRWHVDGDIDLTGWNGGDQYFSTHLASPMQFDVSKHLLFPIPQSEVDRNDAITDNNPGY
jgi:starch-binding outer membrane protein, SusD/RagB family